MRISLVTLMQISLLSTALTACGGGVFGTKKKEAKQYDMDLSTIENVYVNGTSGDVTITAAEAGVTQHSVEFIKRVQNFSVGTGGCHAKYNVEGKTLTVKIEKDVAATCEIDTRLLVPATSNVDVKVDNGEVDIKKMQGPISVKTDNGSIDAELAPITADKPVCNASFKTDNGEIKVKLAYAPGSGALSASTDNGDIKIRMPSDTAFTLTEDHDSGDFENKLALTPDAPFAVKLKTDNGDIKVEAN